MRQWATILTIASLAGFAAAQTTRPAATAFYEAQVNGQDVYVRSSSDTKAYHCTQLSSPARVTVVGSDASGEWCKILPPPGCYSVISKVHIRLDADGKSGTVISNNAAAKAYGYPRQADNYSILQKPMKAGDTVRIVPGDLGSYYKIEPPAGVHFWIAAKFVTRIGPVPTAESSVVPTAPTDPTVAAYQQLYKEMLAEWKKPPIQRDYLALAAKFEALKVSKESGLKTHVDAAVAFLKQQHQRLLDKASATKVKAAGDSIDSMYAAELANLSATGAAGGSQPAARGIVARSVVYPGSSAIRQRLILRDEKTPQIRAYLEISAGGEKLSDCLGMLVEVYGSVRYDSGMATDIIQVQKFDIVDRNAVLPALPSPTLGPVQAPKPKPVAKPTPTTKPSTTTAPAKAPATKPAA